MKKLQYNIDDRLSIYMYDHKTDSNQISINPEEVMYEFVFSERPCSLPNIIDNGTCIDLKETYGFDCFIVTKDDYLMRIKGVRHYLYYAVCDDFVPVKLAPNSKTKKVLQYLLDFCSEIRTTLSNFHKKESTCLTGYFYAYWLIRKALEEELSGTPILENVISFVPTVDEIANRLNNIHTSSWNVIHLEFNRIKNMNENIDVNKFMSKKIVTNYLVKYHDVGEYNRENVISKKTKNCVDELYDICLEDGNNINERIIATLEFMFNQILNSKDDVNNFILDVSDMHNGELACDLGEVWDWMFSYGFSQIENEAILFNMEELRCHDKFKEMRENQINTLMSIAKELYPDKKDLFYTSPENANRFFYMVYKVQRN